MTTKDQGTPLIYCETHLVDSLCSRAGLVRRWYFDTADKSFKETLLPCSSDSVELHSSLANAEKHAFKAFLDGVRSDLELNEPLMSSWLGLYRRFVTRYIGTSEQKKAIKRFLSEYESKQNESYTKLEDFLRDKKVIELPREITTTPLLDVGATIYQLDAVRFLTHGEVEICRREVSSISIQDNIDFATQDIPSFSFTYKCHDGFTFSTDEGVELDIVYLRGGKKLFLTQESAEDYLDRILANCKAKVLGGL